ncbi:MAG: indolepyruvate ferredoxin oxidoreductase family protein, partial [Phenylobacterium sp.]|nr:indolepyruvate ferredoxin oxidoreductase family protein [Phenylobacterium sp.]
DAGLIDATGIATALIGDSIATNLFMLGYAWQRGLVPLGFEAIDRAIELNGVALEANRKAFAWGRLAAHDPQAVEAVAAPPEMSEAAFDLAAFVAARSADLVGYQDEAYAERYRRLVERIIRAETARFGGPGDLSEAVARFFYKLMAYKDEYEVARLYADGRFAARIAEQFEGDYRLEFNLAPPLLARKDPASGELRKSAYGAWMMTGFRLLARLKGLRGSAFDIFGYQAERRIERGLVDGYERAIADVAACLSAQNRDAALEIARAPDAIRGYGHVKKASIERSAEALPALLATLRETAVRTAVEA